MNEFVEVVNRIPDNTILAYTIIKSGISWLQVSTINQCFNSILKSINQNLKITKSVIAALEYASADSNVGVFRISEDDKPCKIIVYTKDSDTDFSGNQVFETFVHEVVHWLDYTIFNEPVSVCQEHGSFFTERCELLSNKLKGAF